MTFLEKIITRDVMVPELRNQRSALVDFDLYDNDSVQKLMETFLEKSICDCDGRHLGFVSDVMISTWNNKPEYLVLDAKLKPWHLRNAQFLYPINSVTEITTVKIMIKDPRALVYESSAFDPHVVELQETFPLLSLKSLAENDDSIGENMIHYRGPSEYWIDGLW